MRPVVLLSALVLSLAHVSAAAFYVSPAGRDSNPGTERAPFATLERARQAMRAVKRDGGGVVYLRGGRYQLTTTLVFTPEDGATAKTPVTYRAFPGEIPIISGGRTIIGWTRVAGDLWSAPLAEKGWQPRRLFVNGVARARARWPHAGFFTGISSPDGKSLNFPAESFPRKTAGGEVIVLVEWSASRQPLDRATIDDVTAVFPDQVLPFVVQPWAAHIRKNVAHFPYYFENLPGEPLEPGTWRYDAAAGRLYYRAVPGERPDRASVLAAGLERLVEIAGSAERPVCGLLFRGLTFAHADWQLPAAGYAPAQAGMRLAPNSRWLSEDGMPAAVRATYAVGCRLQDCRFLGLAGAGLSLERGCRENVILGNEFADIGGNGVQVGEINDLPEADRVRDNVVRSNYLHACGVLLPGCVGIWNGITQGTEISYNEVCDLPYTGISVGWDWSHRDRDARRNRVEYNHVHHVMRLLADGAGIYTLGKQPDSTLIGNHIHDIFHASGVAPTNGIFQDNGSEGWVVDGNIIYRTADGAIRYNTADTNAAFQKAGHNYCDILPEAPGFPADLAAKAGLESAFRGLLKARTPVKHLDK